MKDPLPFLERLASAYAVTKFTFTFKGPSAFDVQRQIIAPAQELVQETGADSGTATIFGDDLDRQVVTDITRSVASTGDNATARIRQSPAERTIAIQLRKDAILFRAEEVDTHEHKLEVLNLARATYQKVRG